MRDEVYSSHAHVVVGSDFEPIGGQRKRAFDLIFAVIALAVGSPFFTFAALMVKFTSRGPLFFRQERIGYGGRLFICYKFRTMVVDADVQLRHEAQQPR